MQRRRLNELKVTNPYLRLGTDVSELEKSIKTLGLIAPLVISSDNVILAGARRYQALLNLGLEETPVMIIDGNALEKELVSIDENLVRKDLTKIEMESHLRRAKEIYQELFPVSRNVVEKPNDLEETSTKLEIEVLPAEKFLLMVSEKTGLSPKQIHEAIYRDEFSSKEVKEARIKGELSIGQTNEIVKLKKEDQPRAMDHIKNLPLREIRKFVKMAKAQGINEAIGSTPQIPNQKDFQEIESLLKRLLKKKKQLQLEGVELLDYPQNIMELMEELGAPDDMYQAKRKSSANNVSYQ
jgi:ParB family chromosome partitioning protein